MVGLLAIRPHTDPQVRTESYYQENLTMLFMIITMNEVRKWTQGFVFCFDFRAGLAKNVK